MTVGKPLKFSLIVDVAGLASSISFRSCIRTNTIGRNQTAQKKNEWKRQTFCSIACAWSKETS